MEHKESSSQSKRKEDLEIKFYCYSDEEILLFVDQQKWTSTI